MKHTQKGFLVPALLILVAILGIGWWMTASKDRNESQLLNTQYTQEKDLSTQSPKIQWSFPVLSTNTETHSTYGVQVSIDGALYDLQHTESWGGVEIPAQQLLPDQLSAVRLSNGDIATEFAVVKDGSGYRVTKAAYMYQRDGADIDAVAWRQKSTLHMRIQ